MKRGIVAWFLVGAGAAVALLSAASIGLFLAPFVAVAAFLLARASHGATATFAAVGAGAVLILVGLSDLDYRPCPDGAVVTSAGESYSCGGPRPEVVIGIGLLAVAGGTLGYARLRRRHISPAASD
jgi:hypothetical protein